MKMTLSLLILFFAFQASTDVSASDDYSTPEKTVEAFAEAIKPSVKTLDHDIFVYHYRPRKNSESMSDLSEKAAAIYTNYVRHTIYGKPLGSGGNMMGAGLYVATDPVASRDYGGENFVLFQIRLAKGSRYWDTSGNEPNIAMELRQAAGIHFGCTFRYFHGKVTSGYENCHSLRKQILRRLNISAIAYGWINGIPPALCPNRYSLAMVLTNHAPFRREDIQVFTKSWFPFAGPNKMNRRILQWLTHVSTQSPELQLWPALNPIWPMTDEEAFRITREWAKKNLLGCE